jgi:DNA invertase Pin-like site-specific DNA recombinase
MKFVFYLRVSTDQQNLGIEVQRDICLKYISNQKEKNYIEFVDDGFSGSLELDKRPGLLASISILEKDDILLVAKRDRLGRDPIVNAMIERAVTRKKAKLISASGDVREDNDPSSILMRRMIDAFAEYERLIIGARTKAALQIKKKKNERVGHIPFGYKLSEDLIHLESNEFEKETLEKLIELRKKKLSYRKIAEIMNNQNVYNRKNLQWNHVSIHRILMNRY